jgi:pimeloyl-ACP methyl ester carboxylesterase
MRSRIWRLVALAGGAAGVAVAAACHLPAIAAGGLLHPHRNQSLPPRPANCADRVFETDGVRLQGWHCRAAETPRGTVIYLHGTADNRGSAVGVIRRFTAAGLDVVAYDSRAHGVSGGEFCTYGYFEKTDLRRVIDGLPPHPVVLFGASLGAAVALQAAAGDARVAAVIAVEVFSDLRTIARERAPRVLTRSAIQKAFDVAEARAQFRVDSVSPVQAARSIRVPVLLVHGAEDRDTPPEHSRRVLAELAGPKRLILVPGAGHNQSLGGNLVWPEIDRWIDDGLARASHPRQDVPVR